MQESVALPFYLVASYNLLLGDCFLLKSGERGKNRGELCIIKGKKKSEMCMRETLMVSFLLVLFIIIGPKDVYANKANVIEMNGGAVRVVDEQNELMAILYKGNKYTYIKETAGCYYIEIENATGCVSKAQATKLNDALAALPLQRGERAIYTKKRASITNKSGQRIAMLEKNRRHYVVGENVTDYIVRIAGVEGYVKKNIVGIDRGIPVLMYHHLLYEYDNTSNYRTSSTITPAAFNRQMRLLHDNGIKIVTTTELEQFLKGARNIPKNAVVLTFDDGLRSNIEYAYPILKQYGYRATNFLITARNKPLTDQFNPQKLQFITHDQLATTTDVFQFEGHTHNLHNVNSENISDVVHVPREELVADLQQSMAFLPHRYFAYPFGQYNEETIDVLKSVGYSMAFTTKDGYVKYGDDPMQLKRKGIYPKMTLQQFKNIIVYE